MPTKTVRFNSRHTYHSPPPNRSYSSSSWASWTSTSSAGPTTPPSGVPHLPKAIRPSPPTHVLGSLPSWQEVNYHSAPVARLHPLLNASLHLPFDYDIRLPPTTLSTPRLHIDSHTFAEPATSPPLPYIRITSVYLPWTITIRASSRIPYVTVSDVIQEIYHSLRANITPEEYGLLPTQRDRQKVAGAYQRRYQAYRRGSKPYHEEKRSGVKRIDFLMTTTRFMGLSGNPTIQDPIWTMNLAK